MRKRRYRRRSDGLDFTQVHLNMWLTVQFELRMGHMESATYCTLFLPRENDIVKEMQDAGRTYNELETNQPSVERGIPHIWHEQDRVRRIEPPRPG